MHESGIPEPADIGGETFSPAGDVLFGQQQQPPTFPKPLVVTPDNTVPDPKDQWALHSPPQDLPAAAPTQSGQYVLWDGSHPLPIRLANQNGVPPPIRSLWFPNATNESIAIYSGTPQGNPIYSTTGAAELVAIPDGNPALTLVASAKFPSPITLYATSDILPPNKVESMILALAGATVEISGAVTATITSGTVSITGTANVNLQSQSTTIEQVGTSDYPAGAQSYWGMTGANVAAGGANVPFSPSLLLPTGKNFYLSRLKVMAPGILGIQNCEGMLSIGTWNGSAFSALVSFLINEEVDLNFVPALLQTGSVGAGLELAWEWLPSDTQYGTGTMIVLAQGYWL